MFVLVLFQFQQGLNKAWKKDLFHIC